LIYFRYQIWSYKNPHFVRNLKKKTKWPTFFTGVGISTHGTETKKKCTTETKTLGTETKTHDNQAKTHGTETKNILVKQKHMVLKQKTY
jgi:hypothetical protein